MHDRTGCLVTAVIVGGPVVAVAWLVISRLGDDFDQDGLARMGWSLTVAWLASVAVASALAWRHRGRGT